ncbi:MAG: endonuclease MutS2 [Anaerolineae bacterium]|jgi:DNA mismatch repair protein MutS2|nr:endonuclease MutS2 [Chloroflexota bacterium]
MDAHSLNTLEYPLILQQLGQFASFSASQALARALWPSTDEQEVRRRQQETTEAKALLASRAEISVGGAHDVRDAARRASLGASLPAEDLLQVEITLNSAREIYRKLAPLADEYPLLAERAGEIRPLNHVIDELARCLDADGQVVDAASPELARLRREIWTARERLLERLRRLVSDPGTARYLQETIVTERNGRYVIPLKVEYRGRIPGLVQDQSSSGATLFIEPLATVELNNHWHELQSAEYHEVQRILRVLSQLVGDEADNIVNNVRLLGELDLALAKAHYSYAIHGMPAEPSEARWPTAEPEAEVAPWSHPLYLPRARHPLLDAATVVPIDVYLGGANTVLVITGPNTGGKTVSLKTVGLLAAMNQAGLHIPAGEGARLPVFDAIHADIGDEQSIEQSLSTFSSHMTRIVNILRQAGPRSLVLLDEIGAGTDPVEGAALAQALITSLLEQGALTLCSSHYSELKVYAFSTPRVENASVEFDVNTLSATYHLSIGLPGRSNAFAIAERLGLPQAVLDQARALVSAEDAGADTLLANVKAAHDEAARERAAAEEAHQRVQRLEADLKQRLGQIEEARRLVLAEAREQARQELDELRSELRQLRRRSSSSPAEQPVREALATLDEMEDRLEPVEPAGMPPQAAADGPLQVGDRVWLSSLAQEGVLEEIDGDDALVSLGGFRLRTELHRLQFRGRPTVSVRTADQTTVRRGLTPSPGMELHLRGLRAAEVPELLDRYIEQAYLAGLPWVHIIHGKGQGILQQIVREQLSNNALVASFRGGEQGEGGAGVTVVRLESAE